MNVSAPLPKYFGFKTVWALQIVAVDGHTIIPADNFAPIECDPKMFARYTPKPGDYLVFYPDGYRSFSPAAAFEAGYALLPKGKIEWQYDDAIRLVEDASVEPRVKRIVKDLLALLGKDPCYLKAAVRGLPTFTLIGTDKLAGGTVRFWALRASEIGVSSAKVDDALIKASALDAWAEMAGKTPD